VTDIVERLRKPLLCEETLEQVLDPIAKLYRAGDTGSLPRDIFESFTDDLDCERAEAAALIASQARRIAELEGALNWVEPAMHAVTCYEADYGEKLPEDHQIGKIDDSRNSASFRLYVGHIRRMHATLKGETP
jgi:hypothetical protein